MVLSLFLSKLAEWLLYQLLANSFYKAAKNLKNHPIFQLFFKTQSPKSTHQLPPPPFPNLAKTHFQNLDSKTLVFDINALFLHHHEDDSFFPYFMLVAFEGGSMLRALLLLLSYPFLWVLGNTELKLRVMIFITFCGLKVKDMERVGRAVLPKFYLENVNFEVFELMEKVGRRVFFTSVPKVMVEGFVKEYLKVDDVVGTEIETVGTFFSGFLKRSGLVVKHRAVKEYFGEEFMVDVLGVGTSSSHDHLVLSLCKGAYVVTKSSGSARLPRDKYPKPLVFHDGRLAFLPTPLATLAMFLWFPLGLVLAILRLAIGILLPYKLANLLGTWTGVRLTVKGVIQIPNLAILNPNQTANTSQKAEGVLYVCSHRTLLDPVMLSCSLAKPLTAVTYSLSKMSEIIAPLKTVRLTRDRNRDGKTMERLLREGDLVVCPEGTTCREPYLLRFSSLFAELADEIVPVAINTSVSMFYGTTASGFKCLDPIFFLMNPRPCYYVHLLGKLPREETCAGGKTAFEVANQIQRQLGDALGFECTGFTRKDKYMMLAGNEGLVNACQKP